MNQEKPWISLERISVTLAGHRILQDISLNIPRGQTLAIIGESGCGKTVLLKTLIALIEPISGSISFDGIDWGKISIEELQKQRLRFGFLFQGAALFDSLTVYDNIAFGLASHGKHKEEEINVLVAQRLQEVGLNQSVLNKKPAELSGGMRKRIGLARALILNPEVMLYDEPTTGLDPIMTDVINELILQTRKTHPVTSIVVTHEMKTVQRVADRVVMLSPLSRLSPGESQILFDGTYQELESCPDPRVAQFIRGEARERLMEIGMQDNGGN